MSKQFKAICEGVLDESDTYSMLVKASIHLNLSEEEQGRIDYDYSQKTSVTFKIDIDTKSWGIKSITVQLISIVPLEISLVDGESNDATRTVVLHIDAQKLQAEKNPPHQYIGVGEIDIVADTNGVIDYSASSIQTYCF